MSGVATDARAQAQTVTITATRTPVRVSDLVAEVTLLDRAALQRSEGRTLVELLSQQAGLQFTNTGGLGKTSGLFMRGLEARHTLLLVDGVRMFSATVGAPSFDNLPLEMIDRIEIVRGPLSALYGSGALGGVIQVFTRRGTQGLAANAKLAVGADRYGQASAGIGWGDGPFDAAVQLVHTRNTGFSATNPREQFGNHDPDRDGFRQNAGSLRLGWQLAADWRVEALALASHGNTGFDDGPGVDARAALRNQVASLSLQGRPMPNWQTRLSVSEAEDVYDTLRSASPFASLGATRTRQRQASWENTWLTPAGALLVLAERLEETVGRPEQPYDVDRRHIDGLALGLSGSAGAHSWQASLRHDSNSQFGDQDVGAAAWGVSLSPAWRLGASLGTSYLAPSFNQLYYPGFGNPLLLPEEGRHGELSLHYTGGEHALRAAAYTHRYRGFITGGPAPVNLPRARIDGLTVSYQGRWRQVDVDASFDHTDPRNATQASGNFDKLLPRRAQRMARFGADWRDGAWSAGGTLAAFSHRFDDPANSTRLAGYATLDLRADWRLDSEWTLGARINNIGDRTYETALGYNQPGRAGFVTLRWSKR